MSEQLLQFAASTFYMAAGGVWTDTGSSLGVLSNAEVTGVLFVGFPLGLEELLGN